MHKITLLDAEGIGPGVKLKKPVFEHEWQEFEYTKPDELLDRLKDTTIAMTCSVPLRAEQLAQLPNVKMISIALTGTDHVDLDYCRDNNIVVCNVPGYAANTVAEHALGMIFTLRRKIAAYHNLLNSSRWYADGEQTNIFFDYKIRDLQGCRLGIVGGGAIGSRLGELAKALGIDAVFCDPRGMDSGPDWISFDELLDSCDFISLHCPLTDETRNLFSREQMLRMKPGSILINTARGGIVNEKDLPDILRNSGIGGVGLDGTEYEPISPDDPLLTLLDLPNFILNPHVGWSSLEAMQLLMDRAIENMEFFVQRRIKNSAF